MAKLKRIGLITPAANRAIEPDFYAVAPKGVAIHTERRIASDSKEKGGDSYQAVKGNEDLERAARYLKGIDLEVMTYACTTGTFHAGRWDYDKEIEGLIEKASGVPCISALHASAEALKKVGAKKISIVGPYGDKMFLPLISLLEAKGFNVVSAEGEPSMKERTTSVVITNQDPEVILNFVPKAIHSEADTIYLPGSAWRALEIADELEKITGKTVITCNQGLIWLALRMVGVSQPIAGYGRLFQLPS
jgi:maleate isomerase